MSINVNNRNDVPRQTPILQSVISLIGYMVSQNINYWPAGMKANMTHREKYEIISSNHGELQGALGKNDDELWDNHDAKLTKWITELSQLQWPPQIVQLYYDFLMSLYTQTATVMNEGYQGVTVGIDNIDFTLRLREPEKFMFGHGPHDFLHLQTSNNGKEYTYLEFFLNHLAPQEKSKNIEGLKTRIRTQAALFPDVVKSIEKAAKIAVIVETGKSMGVLMGSVEREVDSVK